MSSSDFVSAVSSNNIPFVKWGSEKKIMMIFSGGPGNLLPRKPGMMTKMYDPFLEFYSIVIVARKTGLNEGCTTEDIADDYAEMIREDLDGHVAVVLGESYGGVVMQHFAGKYGDLAGRFIIAIAANRMSEEGKQIDLDFAGLLSRGKPRSAAARIADAIIPRGIWKYPFKFFFCLVGGSVVNSKTETFKTDIVFEAVAETSHDATENIKKIDVPVLMICGDSDIYFPIEYIRETSELNSNIILKVYKGKGHMGTMNDKRYISDVLEFARS